MMSVSAICRCHLKAKVSATIANPPQYMTQTVTHTTASRRTHSFHSTHCATVRGFDSVTTGCRWTEG